MTKKLLENTQAAMTKALESLQQELRHIRAGGASAMMLDAVLVEAYGSLVPIHQVGNVVAADPKTIVVTPFDKSDKNVLKNIEKGILNAQLNLNPQNDGIVVRISIPMLTEEKRRELVKKAKEVAEKSKVRIRTVRQEAYDALKKGKKEGDFSEDEVKRLEKDVQKFTDDSNKKIEDILKVKEKELMTI